MTLGTFLSGSLSAAVAFLIVAVVLALPLLLHSIRRDLTNKPRTRRIIVAAVAILAFLLIEGAVYANQRINVVFSNIITSDHYDYSALDAQVKHCTLDPVTCSLIDANPPQSSYDTRPWQYQLSSVIIAVMASLFCAGAVWFLTKRPDSGGNTDQDSSRP